MDDLDPYLKVRAKICMNNPKAYFFLVLIHTPMFATLLELSRTVNFFNLRQNELKEPTTNLSSASVQSIATSIWLYCKRSLKQSVCPL